MWYWKQTGYYPERYTLVNQRTGQSKDFTSYGAMYDFCKVHCINAKQV
jgi:hypothetical protein